MVSDLHQMRPKELISSGPKLNLASHECGVNAKYLSQAQEISFGKEWCFSGNEAGDSRLRGAELGRLSVGDLLFLID